MFLPLKKLTNIIELFFILYFYFLKQHPHNYEKNSFTTFNFNGKL